LYAKSDFVRRHGRQALSIFVLQVVGLVVIDLFRPLVGAWVYVGWGIYLVLTFVLQAVLAAGALTGRAGELRYIPK
jgi:hypothetical protein